MTLKTLQLSSEQQEAVDLDRPAIVLTAPAGSGKTEVVARRIERLLRESPDEEFRILALSYTERAADALAGRIAERVRRLRHRVEAKTIHGFAFSLLQDHGTHLGLTPEFDVLAREDDRAELLTSWLGEKGRPIPPDIGSVLRNIDLARAEGRNTALLDDWRSALQSADAVDFLAMLEHATVLLEFSWARRIISRVYRHIIVDEAQNLTSLQHSLLLALIGPANTASSNVMMVGDPTQSIIAFAGADASLMERFADEYSATRLRLKHNYRSAGAIVRAATAIRKELGDAAPLGGEDNYPAPGSVTVQSFPSESAEADHVATWIEDLLNNGIPSAALAPGESGAIAAEGIAVLGRSASVLLPVRHRLAEMSVPTSSGSTGSDWMGSEPGAFLTDLIDFRASPGHRSTRQRLAVSVGTEDIEGADPSEARTPWAGALLAASRAHDLASFIEEVQSAPIDVDGWEADLQQLLDVWSTLTAQTNRARWTYRELRLRIQSEQRGAPQALGVHLITIHRAQGREYGAVALVGCNAGQIPDFRATTRSAREEELRAFYVAITRPSRCLLLTRSDTRQTRYGMRRAEPSPFLTFIRS